MSGPKTTGQRVREFREAAGLSLSQLAKLTSISRSYLYQVESGESSPTEEKLVPLARALGVSVAVLVGEREETPEYPPTLVEFAAKAKLPPEDVQMLARVQYRGKRPQTVDAWEVLYSVIKTVSKGDE